MSRSRMFDNDEPTREGHTDEIPSPRTTIVGGRPPESDTMLPAVPVGIQELLRLACVDDSFRRELLRRRADIATAAGISLTHNERAILTAVPAQQLEAMIDGLPPPPVDRRTFLRETATAAVLLLGGAAVASCEKKKIFEPPDRVDERMQAPGGAAPDYPPPRPDHNEMVTEGGSKPDSPPERAPENEMKAAGGAAPDFPLDRPVENEMKTRGGAAPDRPSKNAVTRGIRPDVTGGKKRGKTE